MKPWMQHLARHLDDERRLDSIRRWDTVEALIIPVYRSGTAELSDERELQRLKGQLRDGLPQRQGMLEAHWKRGWAHAVGPQSDPLVDLLDAGAASDYVDNWTAMRPWRVPAILLTG